MSTQKTVAIHTLGCKLNFSESSSIQKSFREQGYITVDWNNPADIFIINTCTVTDQADKKCRKAVRKALKLNEQGKVIIIGCYAQIAPEELRTIPGVTAVLGAAEKFRIQSYLNVLSSSTPGRNIINTDIKEVEHFVPAISGEERTRSFLKIQDGCDYKCSFCTIPRARGKSRSGDPYDLLHLAQECIGSGVKEIVFTGVNIGDYRFVDNKGKKWQFIDLLKLFNSECRGARFRISSIEPNLCTDEIIDLVGDSDILVPHFHMPLQSGHDDILAKMRRRYKRQLYADRVNRIKEILPFAAIGVDVIVGFPGETKDHFLAGYNFIENLRVSYLHVFSFSERKNTDATLMDGVVWRKQRKERSDSLRKLSKKKSMDFYKEHYGDVRTVLFEKTKGPNVYEGFTDNYIPVRLTVVGEDLSGRFKDVCLSELVDDYVIAQALECTG